MWSRISLLAALLVAGCDKPEGWTPTYPPDFFAHWTDRQKERFPELQSLFGPSCFWRMDETQTCFKMTEPRRWTGLLRIDFEESRFCSDHPINGRAEVCENIFSGGAAWLRGDFSVPGASSDPTTATGLYRVDFIGRRTEYPGHFGHMGDSQHEIIVDKMIAIRKLPSARASDKWKYSETG